jgi:L-2,4-diaminobutyrate transaminase
MSASLISEPIWQVILEGSREVGPFGHGYTYSAHPVAAAAAMANLDIIEGEGLVERARETGSHFQSRMREAFGDHPLVGHVRGEGLMLGVELVADKATRQAFDPARKVAARLTQICLDDGLITRSLPGGDITAFSPPLALSREEVDQIVERYDRGLAKLVDWLRAEGLWQGR